MSRSEALEAARRIHADLPVVDGHNDLAWQIRVRAGSSLDAADPAGPLPGYQTDVARLLAGGVGAQFWSVYVPAWSESPFVHTVEQIDLVGRMLDRCSDRMAPASCADDVERIRSSGRVAGLLGAEGGHCIEGSLAALRTLFRLGVRYLTLTHSDTIDWADSATDAPRHGGLTDFGLDVIREMNGLGMLVDISHVSAATMRDALAASEAPVIASHSSAAALADHPRNLPDDVLRGVAAGGGVVMVNFFSGFIVPAAAAQTREMFDELRGLREHYDDEAAFEAEAERRRAAGEPLERGTAADVADHVEHIVRTAGIDHVGVGADYDGADVFPAGLEDVSCYPHLTAELLARGWAEQAVRKLLGENVLRVLRAAERVAERA